MKITTENDRVLGLDEKGDIGVQQNFTNDYWFWDDSRILDDMSPLFVPCNMVVQNYSDEIRAHVY